MKFLLEMLLISWNAVIVGYAQSGRFEEALTFFEQMIREGVTPNMSTLLNALSACAQFGSLKMGNWVSSWIEEHGLGSKNGVGATIERLEGNLKAE